MMGFTVADAASSAPATTTSEPRSAPMASTATRTGSRLKLRSRSSERLDLAPAVRLVVRTDAVRPLGLMADRAFVHARRFQAVRGPPLVAARLRLPSLGDCHCRPSSIATPLFRPWTCARQWDTPARDRSSRGFRGRLEPVAQPAERSPARVELLLVVRVRIDVQVTPADGAEAGAVGA